MAPKWKYFYGCIAPTLLDRHSYDGPEPLTTKQRYELTLGQARKMARELIGKPIRTEHDKIDVGVITNSWIKQSRPKQWWVQMAIDESKSVGANQVDLITANLMRGLSLTHWTHTLRPVEVSLCKSPAREGAGIVPCDEDPDFQQEPLPTAGGDAGESDNAMDADADLATPLYCSLACREPILVSASNEMLTINYGGLSMRRSADLVNQEGKLSLPDSRLSESELLIMATGTQLGNNAAPTGTLPPAPQLQSVPPTPGGLTAEQLQQQQKLAASLQNTSALLQAAGTPVNSQVGGQPQQIFQFFPQGSQSGPGSTQQPQPQPQQQQQQQQPQYNPHHQNVMNYPPSVGEQFTQQFEAQQRQFQHANRMQMQDMQNRRGALGMPPQTQLDQFARGAGMGIMPGGAQGNTSFNQQQQQQQLQQQQQQRLPNDMDISPGIGGQAHVADNLQQMMDDAGQARGLNGEQGGVGDRAGIQPEQPGVGGAAQMPPADAGSGAAAPLVTPAQSADWQHVVKKLMNSNVLSSEQKKVLLKGINGVVAENKAHVAKTKAMEQSLKEYQQEKIHDREMFRTVFMTWMMAQNGGSMPVQRKQEVEKAFNEGKFDEMLKVGGKDMLKASQNSLAEHQMLLQLRASQPQVDPAVLAELENFNTLMGAASGGTSDAVLQGSSSQTGQQPPVIPGQFVYTPPDAFGGGGGMSPMSLFGTTGVYSPSGQPVMNFQGGAMSSAPYFGGGGGGTAAGGGAMMPGWQQKQGMMQPQQPLQASGASLQFTQQQHLQYGQQAGPQANNANQQQQGQQPVSYGLTQTAKLTINSSSPDVQNYLQQASARLSGMKATSQNMSWSGDFGKKTGDALYGNSALGSPNVPSGESVGQAIGRKRRALGAP